MGFGAGPVYQPVRKCFSILMTRVTVPATCCLSALFAGREGQRSQLRPPGSWFLALSTIRKSPFIQSGQQVTGPTWPSVPRSPACYPRVPLPSTLGSTEGRLPALTPLHSVAQLPHHWLLLPLCLSLSRLPSPAEGLSHPPTPRDDPSHLLPTWPVEENVEMGLRGGGRGAGAP